MTSMTARSTRLADFSDTDKAEPSRCEL
jgi:hypothetical protein